MWMVFAVVSCAFVQPSGADQISKSIDKNGKTIYTNLDPPNNSKVETIQSRKNEDEGAQNNSNKLTTNQPQSIDKAQGKDNKAQILAYSKESKLHFYAGQGDLVEVKSLISRGSNINDKTESGHTPLHIAAIGGHVDVIKYLLSVGAKINEKNSKAGQTALHLATRSHQDAAVEALLNSGANIEEKNQEGRTPLFYADNAHVANMLLAKGANINARDNEGRTPIFNAKNELISFYVGKGADIQLKDKDGFTVYEYYVKNGQRASIEKAFKEYGKEETSKISATDEAFGLVDNLIIGNNRDNLSELEALFARNPNLVNSLNSTSNKWGNTILHQSVSQGFKQATEFLISKGIKVDRKNDKGETPLHHASNVIVIKALLGAGANVNVRDHAGMTPLHHLIEGHSHMLSAYKDCIILLLNSGAKINMKDNRNRTPYDIGLEKKNTDQDTLQLLKI